MGGEDWKRDLRIARVCRDRELKCDGEREGEGKRKNGSIRG